MTNQDVKRCPEEFARKVMEEMLRLRGWVVSSVPMEIKDDVFDTMARHEEVYVKGYASGMLEDAVAKGIQYREWES